MVVDKSRRKFLAGFAALIGAAALGTLAFKYETNNNNINNSLCQKLSNNLNNNSQYQNFPNNLNNLQYIFWDVP